MVQGNAPGISGMREMNADALAVYASCAVLLRQQQLVVSHWFAFFIISLYLFFPLLCLITSIICRETDQSVIQFGWHSPIVCPSMASLLSQDSDTVALCLCMHHTCVYVCVCVRQTAAATLGGASSISSHPVPTPSPSLYTHVHFTYYY